MIFCNFAAAKYNRVKKMANEIEKISTELRQAVADIKAAILQGQYEACKGVNRIQLEVPFTHHSRIIAGAKLM